MKKSLCIIYSSRKGGHKFPAEALSASINQHYGSLFKTDVINLLEHSESATRFDAIGRFGDLFLRSLWKAGYYQLERPHSFFSKVYRRTIRLGLTRSLSQRKMVQIIGKRPDLFLSIQPEINCIAPVLKGWFGIPIHTVIIDYSVHNLWIHSQISRYYVANSLIADKAVRFGVPRAKIRVTGIPVREGFLEVMSNSVQQQRQRLGLRQDLPTIAILGGFLGTMVDYYAVIQSIVQTGYPVQLLVVFGKNEAARRECQNLTNQAKGPIHSYGAISNMHDVMWAADLIVSKPGSVTMAEALALGKPLIVIDPKAGSAQEIVFANFLSSAGAGIRLSNGSKVGSVLVDLLSNHQKLKCMSERAKELGIRNRTAFKSIVQSIMEVLRLNAGA